VPPLQVTQAVGRLSAQRESEKKMPRCNKCYEHCDELEGVFVYEDDTAVFYCDGCYVEMRPRKLVSRPTPRVPDAGDSAASQALSPQSGESTPEVNPAATQRQVTQTVGTLPCK